MSAPLRVAVLVSGEGTTAEALALRLEEGPAVARVVLALADRECPAVGRLTGRGVPTRVLPRRGTDARRWGDEATRVLADHGVEAVVLAGFLSIVPPQVLERFPGRVINVHPSLLPRHGGPGMYGARVHEAVLADGDLETGVTVHLVTAQVDAGPILWQRATSVAGATTPQELRERVRPLEIEGLTEVIEGFARQGRGAGSGSPR